MTVRGEKGVEERSLHPGTAGVMVVRVTRAAIVPLGTVQRTGMIEAAAAIKDPGETSVRPDLVVAPVLSLVLGQGPGLDQEVVIAT